MTRIRRRAAVAAGVFVLFALGGSQASAFPVFTGGTSTGHTPGTLVFKPVTLQMTGGSKLVCPAFSASYRLISETTLQFEVDGVNCALGKEPCRSGAPYYFPVGHIHLELQGTLVYLNAAKHKVAVLATPYTYNHNPRWTTLEIECVGEDTVNTYTLAGNALATIAPVNKIVTPPAAFSFKWVQKESWQKPLVYEGSGETRLYTIIPGGALEPTGLSLAFPLSFGIPLEIAG
jgi:hypothetical protein